MRSIHSLKSRPAFQMTLLPSRHSYEPSTGHPPKKKRSFYDHRATAIISELEEDPDNSDDNSTCWDDDSSSNNSSAIQPKLNTIEYRTDSINKRRHSSKRSSTRGIKDLFQFSPKEDSKKKRESLSNLFTSGHVKNKQQVRIQKSHSVFFFIKPERSPLLFIVDNKRCRKYDAGNNLSFFNFYFNFIC